MSVDDRLDTRPARSARATRSATGPRLLVEDRPFPREVDLDATSRSWRRFMVPLGWYLISRILVMVTVALATRNIERPAVGPWPRVRDVAGSWMEPYSRWDAAWYLHIARNGYPQRFDSATDLRTMAFHPVLPGMMRTLSELTGWSLLASGIAISLVAGGLAVCLVAELVDRAAGPDAAVRAAALVSLSPASFVFNMPYTEGIAIAAACTALLLADRRSWIGAGVAAALATATRPTCIVLIPALIVAALAVRDRRALWAPFGAVVGVAATWASWAVWTGEPTAWLTSQRAGWKDTFDFGRRTVERIVTMAVDPRVSLEPVGLVDLVCAGGAVVGLWALWQLRRARLSPAVTVHGIAAFALAFGSQVVGPRPRMLLGAFPLLAAIAITRRDRRFRVVVFVSAVALVLLTWTTMSNLAAAP